MKDDTRCADVAATWGEGGQQAVQRLGKGLCAGEERSLEDEEKEGRGAERGSGRDEEREERQRRKERTERERERNADRIISNAPQHVAPVGPPPGCQTCFFLCAIVSKVQRERGCRINVVRPSTDFNIRSRNRPRDRRQKEFDVALEVTSSRKSRRVICAPRDTVRSEIHCRNTTGGANSDH